MKLDRFSEEQIIGILRVYGYNLAVMISSKDKSGGSYRPLLPQRLFAFGVLFAALCVICAFILFCLGDFQEVSPARETDQIVAATPMANLAASDISGPAVVGARSVIEPPGAPGPSGREERLRWLKSLSAMGDEEPAYRQHMGDRNPFPGGMLVLLGRDRRHCLSTWRRRHG